MINLLHSDPRPMIRKNAEQVAAMREAGRLLRETHALVREHVRPGVSDTELDRVAAEAIDARDSQPLFLGYRGFPATICCSINSEVVHGIPRGRRLEQGDIVSIDIGLRHKGYCADSAWTYAVGPISDQARRLLEVTEECLWRGIATMREGARMGDIGATIQACAESAGYGVVRDFTGHGIGRQMHEPPEAPNFGEPGKGKRLRAGVAIALEPMINLGGGQTRVLDDEWTVVTADGSLSAHFEHTAVVTEDGPEVLTA